MKKLHLFESTLEELGKFDITQHISMRYNAAQLLLVLLICTASVLNAQNVNIPDANFKAELVANSAINTNADTEIQMSEAVVFSGAIDVAGKSIASLVGIEALTALTTLWCYDNQLTTLNLSANTALIDLRCSNNQLTTLDLSTNTALAIAYINSNQLTTLNLSTNTALTGLECNFNQLTTLNLSTNTALTYLSCHHNQLPSLDVSTNTALIDLWCYDNQLTTLDLSTNTALVELRCSNNQLTTLDFSTNTALGVVYSNLNLLTNINLSANTALTQLECHSNQLTTLDLSTNTALNYLYCSNNQLVFLDLSTNVALAYLLCSFNQLMLLDLSANTALAALLCENNELMILNVKNGNNVNMSNTDFNATNNPNLICIEVDDILYSSTNWTNIDTGTSFSTNCFTNTTTLTNEKMDITAYPNPTNGNLTIYLEKIAQNATISIHNTMGQTVFSKEYNGMNQIELNLEGAAGMYFVKVRTELGEVVMKVVKD